MTRRYVKLDSLVSRLEPGDDVILTTYTDRAVAHAQATRLRAKWDGVEFIVEDHPQGHGLRALCHGV